MTWRVLLVLAVVAGVSHAQPIPQGGLRRVTTTSALEGAGTLTSPLGLRTDCDSSETLAWDGDSWECTAMAGGVSDGDYGDITVSMDGTVWSVDSGAVAYSELSGAFTTANAIPEGNGSGLTASTITDNGTTVSTTSAVSVSNRITTRSGTASDGTLSFTAGGDIAYIQASEDGTSGSSAALYFTNGLAQARWMVLDASGNLGIGSDTTPDAKLDVQGTLQVDGAATFSSTGSFTGNLSTNGNLTAGNDASDTVYAPGTVGIGVAADSNLKLKITGENNKSVSQINANYTTALGTGETLWAAIDTQVDSVIRTDDTQAIIAGHNIEVHSERGESENTAGELYGLRVIVEHDDVGGGEGFVQPDTYGGYFENNGAGHALYVVGTTRLQGNVMSTGNLSVSGALNVTGALGVTGAISDSNSSVTVDDGFLVTGDAEFWGDTTIGNSATDSITFSNGPSGINTYDGTHLEWSEEWLYAQTANTNNVSVGDLWGCRLSGANALCTSIAATGAAGRPGVQLSQTGSASNGYAILTTLVTAFGLGDGDMQIDDVLRWPTLSDGTSGFGSHFGFGDTPPALLQANGCGFLYDERNVSGANSGNLNKLIAYCCDASTCTYDLLDGSNACDESFTSVDTPVVADTWMRLSVRTTGTTRVEFYVDGTKRCGINTNLPSARFGVARSIVKSAGNASRSVQFDHTLISADLTSARSP